MTDTSIFPLSLPMRYTKKRKRRVLPPQLALNDKIPNPQGATLEGTTRKVTPTYPLTLGWLFSKSRGVSIIRITKAIGGSMKLKGDVER
jgi:hypothetical protein